MDYAKVAGFADAPLFVMAATLGAIFSLPDITVQLVLLNGKRGGSRAANAAYASRRAPIPKQHRRLGRRRTAVPWRLIKDKLPRLKQPKQTLG